MLNRLVELHERLKARERVKEDSFESRSSNRVEGAESRGQWPLAMALCHDGIPGRI